MGALRIEDLPYYTYDDYVQWEGRWELICGMPYAMSPLPTITHQEISHKIAIELHEKLKDCKLCKSLLPVDWKIDEDTVVQPDNLIVCGKFSKGNYLKKTPSVIFEIFSPSTKVKDRNQKFYLYQEAGVKYYVMVESAGMFAEVHKLINGRYKLDGEYKNDKYLFELDSCSFEFDFEKIFDLEE